jgi:hypothetical protein
VWWNIIQKSSDEANKTSSGKSKNKKGEVSQKVKRSAIDTVPSSFPGPPPSSPSRSVRMARKQKQTSELPVSPTTSVTKRATRRANRAKAMNRLANKKTLSKNLEYSKGDETESE